MNRFWLVGFIALGLATPASAADLAYKAPAPVPPPIYDWTGFYIGGNGGWLQTDNCVVFSTLTTDFSEGCHARSGGLAGGQLGYRWQNGPIVFGVEAQGDWAGLSNTQLGLTNPNFETRVKTDAIGLFTGQIGYAWNAALVYVKGGGAVAGNRFDILSTANDSTVASASTTRWGGSVGVGFEYGVLPNLSIGAEYDHVFMGHANFSIVNPIIANSLDRVSQDIDMVTVRINYRFGGYGYGLAPVGAKY